MFGAFRRSSRPAPRLLFAWASVAALLAVGIASCGGKGGKAGAANKGLVGRWESTERSQGALGNTLELTADGKLIYTMGGMVNGRYTIEGDQLTVSVGDTASAEAQKRQTGFRVAGDTLTVIPPNDYPPQALARVGKRPGGPPVAGNWSYRHPAGGLAYEVYTPGGVFLFRLPLQTVEGTYTVKADTLELRLANAPVRKATFTVTNGTLLLSDAEGRKGRYVLAEETLCAEASRAPASPMDLSPPAGAPPAGSPPANTPPPMDQPSGGQ